MLLMPWRHYTWHHWTVVPQFKFLCLALYANFVYLLTLEMRRVKHLFWYVNSIYTTRTQNMEMHFGLIHATDLLSKIQIIILEILLSNFVIQIESDENDLDFILESCFPLTSSPIELSSF